MIIDLILDRRDGGEYDAPKFYRDVMNYGTGEDIADAMDAGTEQDVRSALARYILDGDYNLEIIQFINSSEWLK